jgi:hypothetical protein
MFIGSQSDFSCTLAWFSVWCFGYYSWRSYWGHPRVLATVFGFSALRRASGEMRVLCYAVVILGLIEVVLYVLQLLIMALTYELITPW